MTKEESSVKMCRVCRIRTTDLAQCPECHFWFCREHDTHACVPEQLAHLQNRVAAIMNRRKWGWRIIGVGMLLGFSLLLGIIEGSVDVGFSWERGYGPVVAVTSVVVASLVLGYVILRHYNHRLRQLGVRFRSIRL